MNVSKRPKPFGVGTDVRVRVSRGPDADGRWYWRADRQAGAKRSPPVWVGWGTPAEASQAVIDRLAERGESERHEQVRTVADLLDCWTASQEDRQDVSPFTRRNARGAAARIAGAIGDVLVGQVNRRTLERMRDRSPDAGATVARDLKYLRQAWAWGREVGACPERELPTVRVERRDPVRTRFTPDRGQVAAILGAVGRVSEGARRGLVLLAATGCRPGELLSLRWSSVAVDGTWLDVDGKTGPRRVALHPSVAAEVRRWSPRHEPCRVVECSANTIRKHLAAASRKLKLPAVSPTSLRRYVVDALYAPGADIPAAAKQMGHSPETAMGIYRQVVASQQAAAVLAAGLSIPGADGEVIDLSQRLSQPAAKKA